MDGITKNLTNYQLRNHQEITEHWRGWLLAQVKKLGKLEVLEEIEGAKYSAMVQCTVTIDQACIRLGYAGRYEAFRAFVVHLVDVEGIRVRAYRNKAYVNLTQIREQLIKHESTIGDEYGL